MNREKHSGEQDKAAAGAGRGREARLNRSIGLPALTAYGVGTMLGAGIYALVGEVAGQAGYLAPLAFLLAALLAGVTAFTYGELASRFPKSAGEAVYIEQGFNRALISRAVGLLVALSGIVSGAALANAFAGYFRELLPLEGKLIVTGIVLLLTATAAAGIRLTVWVAVLITLTETGGLIAVLVIAGDSFADAGRLLGSEPIGQETLVGLGAGMVLAFYAYVGFEDMVNVAEEVKQVRRSLPLAIILALIAATAIYILVAAASVLSLPPAVLAASDAPLTDVVAFHRGGANRWITVVSLIAILNGALVQIIMASRVFYGMANEGWLPPLLARVQPRTATPVVATLLAGVLVLVFALALDVASLARATSMALLAVFGLVNGALCRVKLRGKRSGLAGFEIPLFVPVLGVAACAGVLVFESLRLLLS